MAIGKGIWFFIYRIVYPFIFYVGKLLLFTVIPYIWAFLRDKVYPVLHKLYLRLPWRRTVLASTLVIVVLGLFLWISNPFQNDGPSPLNTAKPIKLPAKEGKWATQLVSGNWEQQKETTKEILQQLGLTVLADDAMPADGDTLFVIPPELTLLAMDGSNKQTTGRLNLAELAHLMFELEFPFAEGQDPVKLLRDGVQNWVNAALENPKQPGAEAPLFLYAMAAQQRPAVDLSADDWMATEYVLTYLELAVFLAAFYQAVPEDQIRETASFDLERFFFEKAHAAEVGACTRFKDYVSSKGEQHGIQDEASLGNYLMQELAGKLTGWGFDKLGEGAQKILAPISIILKIQKLAMIYGALDMSLTADQSDVHKPGSGEAKEVAFKATVGVDEGKYKEYLEKWYSSPAAKTIKDCLAFFGLPMPTDLGDIASEVENWSVSWNLYGSQATWGTKKNEFTHPAQRKMKLKRTSDTHGEAVFIVDMKQEPNKHEGDEVKTSMSASVTLHSDQPPVISKFIDAGKAGAEAGQSDKGWGLMELLGLGDVLAEVLAGWLQRVIDPVKYYDVEVTEHVHRFADYTYTGTVHGVSFRAVQNSPPGYVGFTRVDTARSTVESTVFSVTLRTSTSSFTPGSNRASWGLIGNSYIEGSYSMVQRSSAVLDCIGGTTDVNMRLTNSGSNSASMEGGMGLSISEQDGQYIAKINMGSVGIYIPYEQQKVRQDNPSGCLHVKPSSIVEKSESITHLTLPSLSEKFTVEELYPKEISGSREIEDKYGNVTRWSWDFIRQDPSESPTYTGEPVAG